MWVFLLVSTRSPFSINLEDRQLKNYTELVINNIFPFVYLKESTKEKVTQSLMIYDILVKRKPSLDQLRSGLKILGVLDLMEKKPGSLATYFLHQKTEMRPHDLVQKIDFAVGTSTEKKKCSKMLLIHTIIKPLKNV